MYLRVNSLRPKTQSIAPSIIATLYAYLYAFASLFDIRLPVSVDCHPEGRFGGPHVGDLLTDT